MAGWIKIHRELMDHWVAGDPDSLSVFLRLLCEANFVDKVQNINGSPVTVRRGQMIFGYPAFSNRSGITVARLRRVMKNLQKDGMIDRQNFSKFSIVSIVNYEQWQSEDRQSAVTQQSGGSQSATPKEGKEGEEGENNPTTEDSGESSAAKCPHGDILSAWAEALPGKRQPRRNMWKPDRKEYKHLAARWKEMLNTKHSETGEPLYTTREEGIAWWRAFFTHISKSPFLMEDHRWFDIKWVVNKTNFYKIIEGNYH